MDNTKTITLMEWCAGYGGIGLGLKRIFGERLRTIAYCELEGYAQANLISKMEQNLLGVAPIWSDVKTFPAQEFHGLVDIFSAGYPCQPFSTAGKRLGEEDPRHLWPHIRKAIGVIRPGFCFFENVKGHITLGFKDICHDLDRMGYRVAAGLFTAAERGAPHKRERFYILAQSNSNRTSNEYRHRNWDMGNVFSCEETKRGQIWSEVNRCPNQVFRWPEIATKDPHPTEAPRCKPRVRGANDGTATTLDRLRLCGNGVVPQTAEKAFRMLLSELCGGGNIGEVIEEEI